jgi:hypothetical protein
MSVSISRPVLVPVSAYYFASERNCPLAPRSEKAEGAAGEAVDAHRPHNPSRGEMLNM